MQDSTTQSASVKPKTIFQLSPDERNKRGVSFARGVLSLMFVMLLTFPVINMVIGFFLLPGLIGRVIAISAQRGKDLRWLLFGAILCIGGWSLPFLLADRSSGFSTFGLFADAAANLAICRYVLLGPLAHLVFVERAES